MTKIFSFLIISLLITIPVSAQQGILSDGRRVNRAAAVIQSFDVEDVNGVLVISLTMPNGQTVKITPRLDRLQTIESYNTANFMNDVIWSLNAALKIDENVDVRGVAFYQGGEKGSYLIGDFAEVEILN